MKQLFLEVGEKYPNLELTGQPDWFRKRYWTKEQEEKFRIWMIAYLRIKGKYSKKDAESTTGMFLLNYGWTNHVPFIMLASNKKGDKNEIPDDGKI